MLVDSEAKEFHKMAPVLHSACLLPFNPLCDCLRKQVTKICIITFLLSNRQLAPTVHKVEQCGCVCICIYIYIYIYIYTYIYIYLERSWDVLTDAYYSNLNQHPNWSHQLRPWHIRIGDYVQVGPLQGPTESYVSDRKGALNIKILWITLNSLTKPDSMFSIEKLWMKSRII